MTSEAPPTLYLPQPSADLPPPRVLNAAHDLIPTFGLLPLYHETVRPYMKERAPPLPPAGKAVAATDGMTPAIASTTGVAQGKATPMTTASRGPAASPLTARAPSILGASSPTGPIGLATNTPAPILGPSPRPSLASDLPGSRNVSGGAGAGAGGKRGRSNLLKPPKSWAHYVEDLPGKVRPRLPASSSKANGGVTDAPKQDHSMREIIFRPETTIHQIVPFDDEMLRNFVVSAGRSIDEIDVSRLASDDEEEVVAKKKKKRSRPQGEDEDRPDGKRRRK